MDEQLRQARAYDLILQAEEHIRRFIAHNLMKHYGEGWLTTGVSPRIQKKVIARSGEFNPNWTITDFLRRLDFGDYKSVILEPPSWQRVFSSQIKDRNDIATDLMELNVYRRSVAHSRPVSQEEFASLNGRVTDLLRKLKLRK